MLANYDTLYNANIRTNIMLARSSDSCDKRDSRM